MSGINRRHTLTGAAAAVVAVPLLAACGEEPAQPSATTDPSSPSEPDADANGGGTPSGTTLPVSQVPEGGGVILADDQVVVTQPTAGEFKAFSAVCTHQGCLVSGVSTTIDCGCHGSQFSLTDGSPVGGPATAPLGAKEVTVDGETITVG